MKSLIASIILLAIIVVGTTVGSFLLSKKLQDIENDISDINVNVDDFDKILEKAISAQEKYEKSKLLLCLFLDDRDEQEIEDYITDIISAAETQSAEEVQIAKSRLISEAEKTRRLFTININSIF